MPNSLTSESNELEDIFADSNVAPVSASASSAPVSELNAFTSPATKVTATEESVLPAVVPGRNRRRWLLIATGIAALLLLGAAGVAVWVWLQRTPTHLDTNTNDDANTNSGVLNIANDNELVTNADDVVNVNTVIPVNTNTTTSFVDIDHDGLSDEEELVENTNPKKKDTDEDGLSDREEVRVYDTDPRNPDTDGDGYTDGDEVTHFYHPNSPDPKQRLFDLPQ